MSSLPLRPLRTGDAEQVATLFAETFGTARRLDAEDIRAWLRNDALKPEWLRVLEVDGSIVGYGDIWIDDVVELDVAAPGQWDVFFDWAESEARAHGKRVRIHFSPGHELEERVARRGYTYWRSSYTMEIDIVDPPHAQLPAGIELRTFRDGADDDTLRAALNEAFAEDPLWHHVSPTNFREFYLRARGYDPSLWFLAWDGDQLAGFVVSFPERGGDQELGWVATLGVVEAWRRRGLGEALLRTAFQALHARGLRRVGLGVDAENVTGAPRLYERVGMRKVRQADIWELNV
jgi:ribosomal protein S18 acetylase RimI-like enzyme